jgi:hypothetical protein
MAAALGREPTDAETAAVASIWREGGERCDTRAADRVFREALRRSRSAHDPEFRRRVRDITADRWVLAAARAARAGHVRQAAACLDLAARWHPEGPSAALALAARRAAGRAAYRA